MFSYIIFIIYAAQLTAVNQPVADDLIFHATYGHNVVLSNENHTASRPVTRTELTGCCVLSSRPLHDDEMFEIVLDTFHNSFVTNTLSAGMRNDSVRYVTQTVTYQLDITIRITTVLISVPY